MLKIKNFSKGDVVSRRGALTGGYVDNRTSKLEIYTVKEDLMKKLHEKEKELKENKEFLQRQEVCITTYIWLGYSLKMLV